MPEGLVSVPRTGRSETTAKLAFSSSLADLTFRFIPQQAEVDLKALESFRPEDRVALERFQDTVGPFTQEEPFERPRLGIEQPVLRDFQRGVVMELADTVFGAAGGRDDLDHQIRAPLFQA